MGYRSAVWLVVPNGYTKEFENLLKDEWWDSKYPTDLFPESTHTTYLLEDWKWYDSYTDVQKITGFLQDRNTMAEILDPDGLTHTSAIVRLGEEFGDYEDHLGTAYEFEIYPTQGIEGV